MRAGSFRRVRIVRGAIVLAGAALALVACVDGTTPNCSDAASGCGPDVDGSIVDATGEGGGDATTDAPAESATDAPVGDAPGTDAPVDAGGDAGDAKAG